MNGTTRFSLHRNLAIGATLILAGCTGSTPTVGESESTLGLTYSIQDDGGDLHIEGRRDGVVAAAATLTLGDYVDFETGAMVYGRTLDVQVDGHEAVHHSALVPVTLPLEPGHQAFNAFLQDPPVAAALAAHDVRFSVAAPPASAAPTERPYSVCTHSISSGCGVQPPCAEFTSGSVTYENVCCNGASAAIHRSCTTAYGTSACGQNGPGGCAVCWSSGPISTCQIDSAVSAPTFTFTGSYVSEFGSVMGNLDPSGTTDVYGLSNQANEQLYVTLDGDGSFSVTGGWATSMDGNTITTYANYGSTLTITHDATGFTHTVNLY